MAVNSNKKGTSGKNPGKTPAKSTGRNSGKKRFARGTVRKAVAGVLLASSLFVAAIPADKSGVGQAGTDTMVSYDTRKSYSSNDDFNPGKDSAGIDISGILDKSGKTIYNSFVLTGSGSTLKVSREYFYYLDKINDETVPIISGYNTNIGGTQLDLDFLYIYDFVNPSAFESYKTTKIDVIDYELDTSPYATDQNSKTYIDFFTTYFADDYDSWKSDFDAAYAEYKAKVEEKGGTPLQLVNVTVSDIAAEATEHSIDTFHRKGEELSEEQCSQIYCNDTSNKSAGGLSLKGFNIVSATKASTDEYPYAYVGEGNSTITGNLPSGTSVYLVKGDTNTANCDENGFRYLNKMEPMAISSEAFCDATSVATVTVGRNIRYIGDDAFNISRSSSTSTTNLETLDLKGVSYIGNRVFYGCTNLKNVNFNDSTAKIGKEAFYNCTSITDLTIPTVTTDIGFGAFANCTSLKNLNMEGNNTNDFTIGEFAFYNCNSLSNVNFPDDKTAIGYGCFAVDTGSDSLETFTFPENIYAYVSSTSTGSSPEYSESIGDFILNGRRNLHKVVFPAYGSTQTEVIPKNTFNGCLNLQRLCLGAETANGEKTTSCSFVEFDQSIFDQITDSSFAVCGPQNNSVTPSTVASPRECTWETYTSENPYVPYIYYDNDGTEHYEVGMGDYRYDLKTDTNDKTAEIVSCSLKNSSTSEIPELIIPGEVGDYSVTSLKDNALDPIKDKVVKVDFGDTLKTVGANIFKGDAKLIEAIFGPAIESVGAGAFENCNNLKHVYWEKPSDLSAIATIPGDAFYTGGDMLYFHGEIDEDYAPFKYAMGNNKINSSSVRVCYVETAPKNLYVVHNDTLGNVLIDYPHYEDLSNETKTQFASGGYGALNDDQKKELDASRMLILPKAIQSVDVKAFVESDSINSRYIDDNSANLAFGSGTTRRKVYSSETKGDTVVPGLFSGYMDETTEVNNDTANGTFSEVRGNDWILRVEMPGVKELPDSCFDSCERLTGILISDSCQKIGDEAFKDCSSLSGIDTTDSTKFSCEKAILYGKESDGLELINCLPGRGNRPNENAELIGGSKTVDTTNDPLLAQVSTIKPGAFINCPYLTTVDLSATSTEDIPENCFSGCTSLGTVKLPATTGSIGPKAFDDKKTGSLVVNLPSRSVNFSDTAFDTDTPDIKVYTYNDGSVWKYKPSGYSQVSSSKEKVAFNNNDGNEFTLLPLGLTYKVQFYNDDGTKYGKEFTVEAGGSISEEDLPADPVAKAQDNISLGRTVFDYWYWMDENGDKVTEYRAWTNISQDRDIKPQFSTPEDKTFTLTFYDDAGNVFGTPQTVKYGGSGEYPDEEPKPALPEHAGWSFSFWSPQTTSSVKNVTEDRTWIAVFKSNDKANQEQVKNDANDLKSVANNMASSPTLDNLKAMINKYNKIIDDSANPADDVSGEVIKAIADMKGDVKDAKDQLKAVGVTIKDDGTLALDDAAFNAADENAKKAAGNIAADVSADAKKIVDAATATATSKPNNPDNSYSGTNISDKGIEDDAKSLADAAGKATAPLSYEKMHDLLEKYNDVITDANAVGKDYPDALRKAIDELKSDTKDAKDKLKAAGITINEDGTLSMVDKAAFEEIDQKTRDALADWTKEVKNDADDIKKKAEEAKASSAASPAASPKASAAASSSVAASPAGPQGYNAIVENGAGSGSYEAGKVVTITAYAAPDGKVFDRWTTSNSDIGFSDPYSASTTFIMPTHDVKVTATYKTPSASSNNAGTNNNNSSGSNNSGNGGSGSGNAASGNNGTGNTEVRITTEAIDNNNKNLGFAEVEGSTDNFVVKVTDSAEASAAVESALRDKYGADFDHVKFVAFDISLYDSTGTQMVANADDLAVNITLPIPDDLVSYAGNNKVGVVVNGVLEDKRPTFTTIDGVPCIKFTGTHFSPYTIYVDTENVVRGVYDETPKTGDGVAPKWFLSAGMMSLSCVLFLWKDKKKPLKKAAATAKRTNR
ncbi:MAG: leucine-rich repeat protein [Lachnospiraceae bacterium]|nr:leucine-rich repeat protein [Lachnospiraceae bacterium]